MGSNCFGLLIATFWRDNNIQIDSGRPKKWIARKQNESSSPFWF